MMVRVASCIALCIAAVFVGGVLIGLAADYAFPDPVSSYVAAAGGLLWGLIIVFVFAPFQFKAE